MLNFLAIDLQLYEIFKITQVSFFGTQCICVHALCRLSKNKQHFDCSDNK